MARWEPDTRARLEAAALDLFARHGFDATTSAQIAAAANVTERTFFRHFPDKREVLFANERAMQDALVAGVAAATGPLVRTGLQAVADALEPRRPILARRAAIIAAHPALRERELAKIHATAAALTQALVDRDVDPDRAEVAAAVAIAVLGVAFDRWLADESAWLGVEVTRALALAAPLP